MSQPLPTGTPTNILVTAAAISVNGVDIGFASNVSITVKEETTEVKTDQLGKSVINHFYVGNTISMEMMLDEYTAAAMKSAYTHGSYITGGGASKISWGKPIGQDYYSFAQQVIVRPTSDDSAYAGRRFTFYKAAPIGDSKFEYKVDGKIQIKTMFAIYPDLTQTVGQWFGFFGDATAGTLTPASAGSATPGGGNVGNGTVSGISVNNSFTKTETWTLTCIHAVTNGGIFAVSGSVTGARGNATVGTTYHSNSIVPSNSEINFTVNDGSTDFAVSDTFTIATVAANYT